MMNDEGHNFVAVSAVISTLNLIPGVMLILLSRNYNDFGFLISDFLIQDFLQSAIRNS
jgi:hypothetical protein